MRAVVLAFAFVYSLCLPVQAFEKLDGFFIANSSCNAWQSKNKRTNPGNVKTETSRSYVMKGINRPGGDYFQIGVPEAPVTTDRWVHVECGEHVNQAGTSVVSRSDDYVLALNWQPSFCQLQPGTKECREVNSGRLPLTETQLSVHGLWLDSSYKEYCGVSKTLVEHDRAGRWSRLPEIELDDETREALVSAMPGTASFLDRHEWIKHGTCHAGQGGADEYYSNTLMLHDAISSSVVSRFLADNVGAFVSTADIRAKFDEAFGDGAGARVQFDCARDRDRVLLKEVLVYLRGSIDESSVMGDLMLAADAVPIGCREGIIDPAGRQ